MIASDLVLAAARLSPASVELARYLSLASRISPGLLRRFRLRFLRHAEPGVEAELWLSPLVEIRSARSILFYPEVAAALRLELAKEPEKLAASRLLLAETRHYRPELVRLEEDLIWLGLELIRNPGSGEATRKLRQIIKAIVGEGRRGLGRWAISALRRLPELDGLREAALLQAVATSHLADDQVTLDPRSGITLTASERTLLLKRWKRVQVGIRLAGETLSVNEPPRAGDEVLEVPATRPRRHLTAQWKEDGAQREASVSWAPSGSSETVEVAAPVSLVTLAEDRYEVESQAAAVETLLDLVRPFVVRFEGRYRTEGVGWLAAGRLILTSTCSLPAKFRSSVRNLVAQESRDTVALRFPFLDPETRHEARAVSYQAWPPALSASDDDGIVLLELVDEAPKGAGPPQKGEEPESARHCVAVGFGSGNSKAVWERFRIHRSQGLSPETLALEPTRYWQWYELGTWRWCGAPLVEPQGRCVLGLTTAVSNRMACVPWAWLEASFPIASSVDEGSIARDEKTAVEIKEPPEMPPAITEPIESITIELHRQAQGIGFVKGTPYIATAGQFAPVRTFAMPLSQRECLLQLHRLRYQAPADDAEQAREILGHHVREILGFDQPAGPGPVQIDLVSNAEELWALPFEACLGRDGEPLFVGRQPPVILTRRIRYSFADRRPSWPTKPRVLFIHAAPSIELAPAVVSAHSRALLDGLMPWVEPLQGRAAEADAERVLEVLNDPTLGEIEAACKRNPYTHIHVLAHGKKVTNPLLPQEYWWALDLGGGEPIGPEELAQAVTGGADLPAIVTIAACDAGSQTNLLAPEKSFAQELHRKGVAVVVASQLPLQKWTSVVLTRSFYAHLHLGGDVRWSLHAARTALYEDPKTEHDWLSMVAYVQLPERYSDLRLETTLQAEIGMLETASRWAGALERIGNPDPSLVQRTENALQKRIQSLQRLRERHRTVELKPSVQEQMIGLLASAHKRLAQFLFDRGALEESIDILRKSRDHYRDAYRGNFTQHWTGVQWLSLEAVLNGIIERPFYWEEFRNVAKAELEERESEFWACGTVAELCLLAPLAGKGSKIEEGIETLELMKKRVPPDDPFPIEATRRQLRRYTKWWTRANGFFKDRDSDLKEDAETLLRVLG